MSLVQAISGPQVAAFLALSGPAFYERGAVAGELRAFARGLRADELVAAAQQYDTIVQALAAAVQGLGLYPPVRFDRVRIAGRGYAVEDWRPSPLSGPPVFVKLLCKGGG